MQAVLKTFKYRLYPTKAQREKLGWTLDRCRELYNAALQERRDAYKMCGKSISFYDQDKQLPEIKEIRLEYKEIGAHVLRNVLKRVDLAFQAFFRRVKRGEKAGYPRFQGYGRYNSFTYPDTAGLKLHDRHVTLPKLGNMKVKLHRSIEGTIKTCTIKQEGTHWYACFACEVEPTRRLPYTDEAIGIDLGLYHFAALSTGDIVDNPRYYRRAEKKLQAAQQSLSRKKKKDSRIGCKGNRRKKAIQRVAKAHQKVRNQRHDFLHKQSRQLVNTYEMIVFEELTPSNMSKSPKPKPNGDGTYLPNGASAKAGLNKSIYDAGWATFITMCQYKAEEAGTVQVVQVNPYKTSQICSACGIEGPHKALSERMHTCTACGVILDRDVNAAINILNLGRRFQNG